MKYFAKTGGNYLFWELLLSETIEVSKNNMW